MVHVFAEGFQELLRIAGAQRLVFPWHPTVMSWWYERRCEDQVVLIQFHIDALVIGVHDLYVG